MSVILVIDKHSVYRTGLRELLETRLGGACVIERSELVRCDPGRHFDLILIDAGSLDQDSLSALKTVHEGRPETRFAVMSTSNTRSDVLSCISAGFHGFLYKLQSDDDLLSAVGDLLSGRIHVPRWIADGDAGRPDVPPSINTDVGLLKLTRRQNEILPLIAQGMSNKEIALHLAISEGTTKIHTAALLRALGARNRTEAAFMAARLVRSSRRAGDGFADHRFVIRALSVAADETQLVRQWPAR